jgi:hypothetical protein
MTEKEYSIIQDREKVKWIMKLLHDIIPENNGIINPQEHIDVQKIVVEWYGKLYDMPNIIED